MVFLTLGAKLCGMFRDMLIASNYATGNDAIAFFTASRIPILLFDVIIGGVISSTFIPVFNEYLERRDEKGAFRFANNYVNLVLLITVIITVFGILFHKGLINLMAPELDSATKELAGVLSNIMFPMVIFTGLDFSMVGLLQSYGEYNIPSMMSFVSNLILSIYFFTFGTRFGIKGLAVAMRIGWSSQILIQIPWLRKFGYRYRPSMEFRSEGIQKAARLALPMLISTWVQPLCSIITMRLASGIDGGRAIPALEYANKLYIIVVGVFTFVVTNLIFPYLSRAGASGDTERVKKLTSKSLKSVALVILPVMATTFVLATPIVKLIYQRGNFTENDVPLTAAALSFYTIGMLGNGFLEVLNKSFFAGQNSKTPMKTAILSMLVNVALSYILAKAMGIGGLALAVAASACVNAGLNMFYLHKQRGRLFEKEEFLAFANMAVSAAVMGGVIYIVYRCLPALANTSLDKICKVAVPCAAGFIAYGILILLTRVSEGRELIKIFMKTGKGGAK